MLIAPIFLYFCNMNILDLNDFVPNKFDGESRVWIYQSSRPFGIVEALQIEALLEDFTANWKSHGDVVKGFATMLYGQFIVLMADEKATGVSGCSTDGSVRMIKEIETLYKVNLFDRTSLAFIVKDKIEQLPLNQFNYAFENGFLSANTLYFNNTVQTKNQLMNSWLIPIKDSWLYKKVTVA